MKAISLWQPWASAIAFELKRFETRSWANWHTGLLAIHAGKKWSGPQKDLTLQWPHARVFAEFARRDMAMPRGALVCVVNMHGCLKAETVREKLTGPDANERAKQELAFGNFDDGRFAWDFRDVVCFDEPIPVKGRQGLFGLRRSENEAVEAAMRKAAT